MLPSPILIVSGTNRPGSYAMKVAHRLEAEYRAANAPAEILSLREMPPEVFDGAAYAIKPPKMVAIQNQVLAASGLHIVTPEYNGSFPGVLKYFIDMLKFPESFEHKPVAFIGEAQGMWGAMRSVEQLIQIFHYRNAHIFPDRIFIANVNVRFDAGDILIDNAIDTRLHKQVNGFIDFVARFPATK